MSESTDFSDPVKLMDDWELFVNNEKNTLLEKCLKVSKILEFNEIDISKEIEKINDLGRKFRNNISESKNPTYLISLLNEFMFDNEKFKGDLEDYYNPKNNCVNYVFEKHLGNPISLCILYSEIAKHVGLELKIVGFPSHMIVKYKEEMILDPFNRGRLLQLSDLHEILEQNYGDSIEFDIAYLDESSTEEILVRLLRNLRHSYEDSYDDVGLEYTLSMILKIFPDMPDENRDLGILCMKKKHYDVALLYLNDYLKIDPNAQDADHILNLIKICREKLNQ
tara:strand:- start:3222 stop:4061 length:840 start_codon:yes stop_codon:yes gene_type:complete